MLTLQSPGLSLLACGAVRPRAPRPGGGSPGLSLPTLAAGQCNGIIGPGGGGLTPPARLDIMLGFWRY